MSQLAGFGAGARTLLGQKFPTRGALAELLAVPPELETAISAALGTYLEALIVDDYDAVEAAAALLGGASGRAAMLPLRDLQPREPLLLPADPDIIGIAASLIGAEDWRATGLPSACWAAW